MKAYDKLKQAQAKTGSVLCVGLDTDLNKLPAHFTKETASILRFNLEIIEAVKPYASSYKLNFAFYEQYGAEGFEILKKTIESLPEHAFIIADAKRGDIGNTSDAYARSCFEYFKADSVTVSPYMGVDSVSPFLKYEDKMVFLLALTSNPGSADFQRLSSGGKPIYKHVIEKSMTWAAGYNLGFVAGATHPDEIKDIRETVPGNVLLIPGVGTQGGDIDLLKTANAGGDSIVNVSRDIIYRSGGSDFAEKAMERAEYYKSALW